MARYVLVGAGAIGSAIGGLLAHSGRDVVLVARGEHAAAMIDRGLRIRCPDAAVTVPAPTVTGPERVRLTVDDVLVLATKTPQAEAAIAQWADVPVHGHDGAVAGRAGALLPVLTAMNGVAGEEIALRYVERVFAVCVWCPVVMIEPGEIIVRGAGARGVFHAGRYGGAPSGDDAALLDTIAREWAPAGLRVHPADDVMAWKHRKLLMNLGNAVQALLGDLADAEDVLAAAGTEAHEVLAAAGVAVVDDDASRAAWAELVVTPVPGEPAVLGGSSWQSLVRGTGTIETDYLNGEIALIARRIGRSAPINAELAALGRRAARDGWRPGSLTADELRARLAL